jgi:heat-inducible transcriptional repressor
MILGDRKLKILKVIIDDYISTAQPIGSRTISKKPSMQISSATIRNEMADLEELGYLVQPHTSAGRIPSDKGYRVYVDSLMNHILLDGEQRHLIRSLLVNNIINAEDVVVHATQLLSKITGLTAVTSLPLFKKSTLMNMKLVKISDTKAMLILVSDSGVVKNLTLAIRDVNQKVLDVIADCMLRRFENIPIEDINVKSISSIRSELGEHEALLDYLVPVLKSSLREIEDFEVYTAGVNNIFKLPEFDNVQKAKSFLDLMDDKHLLYESIKEVEDDSIKIWIGNENLHESLQELSVIVAPYSFSNKNDGRLCIIGPTRMDYEQVISVIEYIRRTLSDVFSGIYL